MTDEHPPREDDEDVPEERTGRGQPVEHPRMDMDIPPGARTMRNLRDRKRIIE